MNEEDAIKNTRLMEILSMDEERHRLWLNDLADAQRHRAEDRRLRWAVVTMMAFELMVVAGWAIVWFIKS